MARLNPKVASSGGGNVYASGCPTRSVLDHATSRWGMLILGMLLDGTHRFSELARRIGGVSERMLAHTLHALEADGFVAREVFPTKPPKVAYSLTPLGVELALRVRELTCWVEQNVDKVLRFREVASSNGPLTRIPKRR